MQKRYTKSALKLHKKVTTFEQKRRLPPGTGTETDRRLAAVPPERIRTSRKKGESRTGWAVVELGDERSKMDDAWVGEMRSR